MTRQRRVGHSFGSGWNDQQRQVVDRPKWEGREVEGGLLAAGYLTGCGWWGDTRETAAGSSSRQRRGNRIVAGSGLKPRAWLPGASCPRPSLLEHHLRCPEQPPRRSRPKWPRPRSMSPPCRGPDSVSRRSRKHRRLLPHHACQRARGRGSGWTKPRRGERGSLLAAARQASGHHVSSMPIASVLSPTALIKKK